MIYCGADTFECRNFGTLVLALAQYCTERGEDGVDKALYNHIVNTHFLHISHALIMYWYSILFSLDNILKLTDQSSVVTC